MYLKAKQLNCFAFFLTTPFLKYYSMRVYLITFLLFVAVGFGFWKFTQEKIEVSPQYSATDNVLDEPAGEEISGDLSEFVDDPSTSINLDTVPQVDGHYEISWKLLAKIDFEERFNEEVKDYIFYPIFHPQVKAFAGKPVQIRGYVIPFQETGDEDLIILSAFPFSNCFFCGNAGPESVMDIQLQAPFPGRLKQDDMMVFRGTLKLNDTDLYYLNYILENAEIVKQ